MALVTKASLKTAYSLFIKLQSALEKKRHDKLGKIAYAKILIAYSEIIFNK